MPHTLKTPACCAMAAVAVVIGFSRHSAAQTPAAATPGMSVEQQNALVQKHCVVCHNNTRMLGGLSLEAFNAAHPDPSVAGMMVSKLEGGAMGASGITPPDHATTQALIEALSAEAAGATAASGGWSLKSFNDPKSAVVTASTVQERPSVTRAGEIDAYALTLTCRKNAHLTVNYNTQPAELQFAVYTKAGAHAPLTSQEGSPRTVAASGGSEPLTYAVDGGPSGSGLPRQLTSLPVRTLKISRRVPDETVAFPFDGLTPTLRQVLSTCSSID